MKYVNELNLFKGQMTLFFLLNMGILCMDASS